jgi:hypothetical protein
MAFAWNKSTPLTGAEAIFNLKALLKLQGWTVVTSGDGAVFAPGDVILVPGAGPGGMANTRAWFRIRSPGGAGVPEFLIQRSTINLNWRILHSLTAGFSGGAPSPTVTPSAADGVTLWGAGTDAAPTFDALFGTDGTYRFNAGADNAAPFGFWSGAFLSGGGAPSMGLTWDPLVGTEPSDGNKMAIMLGTASGSVFSSAAIQSTSSLSLRAIWSTVAAVAPSIWQPYHGLSMVAETGSQIPFQLTTNPISIKDEIIPIPISRRSSDPNPGWKGVLSLMKWCGTSRTTGDTLSVATSRDRIVYGAISLPWDGTVPVV